MLVFIGLPVKEDSNIMVIIEMYVCLIVSVCVRVCARAHMSVCVCVFMCYSHALYYTSNASSLPNDYFGVLIVILLLLGI